MESNQSINEFNKEEVVVKKRKLRIPLPPQFKNAEWCVMCGVKPTRRWIDEVRDGGWILTIFGLACKECKNVKLDE